MAVSHQITKAEYLERKREAWREPAVRSYCAQCKKPEAVCYCHLVRPFATKLDVVILIHPEEARRHIASARMAHLNLSDSQMIEGVDFSRCRRLTDILSDPSRSNWLLYPGASSIALGEPDSTPRFWQAVPPGQRATIIVIDGTWRKVGRMVASRPELLELPRLSFQPPHPSQFRIRKQPEEYCWSTLEAIDFVIEQTQSAQPLQRSSLQSCFSYMVEQQLAFEHRP